MQQLNKFKIILTIGDNFFCNMIVKSPCFLVNYSLNYYCYEKKTKKSFKQEVQWKSPKN